MQIVSQGDNLHEISKPISLERYKKYFKMSSAETFAKHAELMLPDADVTNSVLKTHYVEGIIRKHIFGQMRTAKVQYSLRILAV